MHYCSLTSSGRCLHIILENCIYMNVFQVTRLSTYCDTMVYLIYIKHYLFCDLNHQTLNVDYLRMYVLHVAILCSIAKYSQVFD